MLPLLLALSVATSAGPKAPTSAAYRKTFENNQHTLVEVIGPSHRGPGVIVGEAGEVLTSVDNVGLTEARVRIGKTEQPAKVVLANAYLKVALVRPEHAPGLRAPAVRAAETFEAQAWLIAIAKERSGPRPQLGRLKPKQKAPFLDTTLPVPPGTPVFDPQGKLVGIAVKRQKGGALVLPLLAVKAELSAQAER